MSTPVKAEYALYASKLRVAMSHNKKKAKKSAAKKAAKEPAKKIEEPKESGGVPVHKYGRGELPAENVHFTSYRVPLDIANALNRIAQKEGASMNDVVIAFLKHGVASYGPVRGYKSDLKPSLHSRQNYGKKKEAVEDQSVTDEGGDEPSTPVTTPVKKIKTVKKGTAGLTRR